MKINFPEQGPLLICFVIVLFCDSALEPQRWLHPQQQVLYKCRKRWSLLQKERKNVCGMQRNTDTRRAVVSLRVAPEQELSSRGNLHNERILS